MSTQEAARLAHMSGQIAASFNRLPEHEAAAAIAGHINQFWAPAMRRDLLHIFAGNPAPLDPRVRLALKLVRPPAARQ